MTSRGETIPEISVLTASYNADPMHLEEALASLVEGNSDVDWEWLIQVDGAAADLPDSLLDDPRIHISYNGRHLGAAATRNMGLVRARAPFVQNLDSDDHLLDGALAALAGALRTEPAVVLSFGRDVQLHEDGSTEGYRGGLSPGVVRPGAVFERWLILPFPPIHPAGIMWRKDALEAYGGWAALPGGEDTAVLIAATQHHPCYFIDRDTFVYRRHQNQLSFSEAFAQGAEHKRAFIQQRARAVRSRQPLWQPARPPADLCRSHPSIYPAMTSSSTGTTSSS